MLPRLSMAASLCLMLGIRLSANADNPVDLATFEDVAAKAGINFVVRNSATPEKHQIETMTSGVAVLDYNNDGHLDIYFVNGATSPQLEKTGASYSNRLFRNNGNGTFTDVTAHAGVAGAGYGMGVAAADYDNDGFVDLFLTGVNRNQLYRNRGDGTFEDVTEKAGVSGKVWSIAAGWFDYDNDGKLDLFVVNYVVWDPAKERFCGDTQSKLRIYCHPEYYPELPNVLFHNNGDGTFTDVSKSSGIAASVGKGMGVVFTDYDGDGRLDVFVANDTQPNFLFHNEGGGKFREAGLEARVALNDDGRALSSMGAAFGDIDNDGREDLFITALFNETFPLFRNKGAGVFGDVTHRSLVARATLRSTGWSNAIADFNNDGFKDLFAANGDVQNNAEASAGRSTAQPNSLLLNRGNGTFLDGAAQAGADFRQTGQHRGAAVGDFDNDGRLDIVVTRFNAPAELFRNTSPAKNHWLAIRLVGRRSNRDGLGAMIRVVGSSGIVQWNRATTSMGFAGSSDRVVHFGLGKDTTAKRIEVAWPSGARQTLENQPADRLITVEEP
jgi:hypothetical protein